MLEPLAVSVFACFNVQVATLDFMSHEARRRDNIELLLPMTCQVLMAKSVLCEIIPVCSSQRG